MRLFFFTCVVKKAARIITPPVPVTQVPVTAPAPTPAAVELPSTQLGKRARDEQAPIGELELVMAVLKYSNATDAEKVALLTDGATSRVMMHAAKLTSQCGK